MAVDIGGTKIAAGVMNENQEWLSQITKKSDASSSENMYLSLLGSMQTAIQTAGLESGNISNLGVTVPGKVDIENGIAVYQNNLPWRNFPLKQRLIESFPGSSITMEHDVVAAALGEWGARVLEKEMLIYVTVSTGLSASIIFEGKPLRGEGMAGEIGFYPVNGRTLEACASGSAMEKELKAQYGIASLREGMKLWQEGKKELTRFFEKKAYHIALGLFMVTATLDPHKIVIGGGVISNQPAFYKLIQLQYEKLCKHPIQEAWINKLEKSKLGDSSALFGAAMKASSKTPVLKEG
nr:ROK family protein [Thalassobacillus pellis]